MSFSASKYTVTVNEIVIIVATHMHTTATFQ